jgi:hypothetical protein
MCTTIAPRSPAPPFLIGCFEGDFSFDDTPRGDYDGLEIPDPGNFYVSPPSLLIPTGGPARLSRRGRALARDARGGDPDDGAGRSPQ